MEYQRGSAGISSTQGRATRQSNAGQSNAGQSNAGHPQFRMDELSDFRVSGLYPGFSRSGLFARDRQGPGSGLVFRDRGQVLGSGVRSCIGTCSLSPSHHVSIQDLTPVPKWSIVGLCDALCNDAGEALSDTHSCGRKLGVLRFSSRPLYAKFRIGNEMGARLKLFSLRITRNQHCTQIAKMLLCEI